MRVCFDSLCFASDRLPEDGDDESHSEPVAMSNGKVITSEGMLLLILLTVSYNNAKGKDIQGNIKSFIKMCQ